MKINIGAGIQFRSGLARDVYAAGGVRPEFVAAFSDGVYRVDSAASTFADAFTFARTGTATFVDASGVLQTAADGVARTGHHIWNGSEWTGPFLQLESEARTNLITHSEDFDDVYWVKNAVTVTANSSTSPDGTLNADAVIEDSTNAIHRINSGSFTLSVGTPFTATVYAKKTSTRRLYLNCVAIMGAGALYDLDAGVVVATSGLATNLSASIFEHGEYYRCVLTGTGTGTANLFRLQINTASASTASDETYLGDGVSGITFFGAQLEAGSTPSSYIPTTGTTVTRNAETLTIAAADAPWSGTAVSIQMEGTVTYADLGAPSQVRMYDWQADANNRISTTIDCFGSRTGQVDFGINESGTGYIVESASTTYSPGVNVPFNIASRYGSTFINGAVDGTALTANTTPTALPDLSAADFHIGPDFMGSIGRIVIWADDIADAGIAAASA